MDGTECQECMFVLVVVVKSSIIKHWSKTPVHTQTTQSTYTSVDDHLIRSYRGSLAAIVQAQYSQLKSLEDGLQGVHRLWQHKAGQQLMTWVLVCAVGTHVCAGTSTQLSPPWCSGAQPRSARRRMRKTWRISITRNHGRGLNHGHADQPHHVPQGALA